MEYSDPDVARGEVVKVLRNLDIYDVVVGVLGRGNARGQLKKKEGTYYALCPFHEERTPSFMVLPGVNGAGCLGCGTTVSPVGFVMKYYGDGYEEKILGIIQETDKNLFDFILEGKAFESKSGLRELIEETGATDGLGIEVAMEESLHCQAYIRKNPWLF